ncbi:MAG: formate acetyltransferase [Anaerolineae bacterium]|nr:formate acetyltransferase [Anaerolineae bacterium]
MLTTDQPQERTYQDRIDLLRARKMAYTQEKQRVVGVMDYDDWGLILPPADERVLVEVIGPSGIPIHDVRLNEFTCLSNHADGSFYGPEACGENYRRLLERHPVFIDPISSLAGVYMTNFGSYRRGHWPEELDFSALKPEQEKYQLDTGIGGSQHFSQDLALGLRLGWGGLLDKIRHYRDRNAPHGAAFYTGLEHVVLGVQNWIARHAQAASEMASDEPVDQLRRNLEMMAAINQRLVDAPPQTFREACQWILWYQLIARMYNGSGSLGRLDVILEPFYQQDLAAGRLSDDEAIFHIACLLLRDTAYLQLGGPDAQGNDVTSPLSYLVLEAVHRLKIPANVGVSVGEQVDPGLLRRGVEILLEDKLGIPKFLGVEQTAAGFSRLGYAIEDGRERVYTGCHWLSVPGREYTMNDMIKIVLPVVFDIALRDLLAAPDVEPSVATLWDYYDQHLRRAVRVIAAGVDFHVAHMQDVFPELVLDLLCHGPIEQAIDASHGGVEYINIGVDGSGLAVVADSFAAIDQRIEKEGRLTWQKLLDCLDSDWDGVEGERIRLMMKTVGHYGHGGTRADDFAQRLGQHFAAVVLEQRTPAGHCLVPGLFSWAKMIMSGRKLGATPDGRRAGSPISQGANPSPGFRKDGAPTALALAVAAVQPGYGNTAPMQIEFEPMIVQEADGVMLLMNIIQTHFAQGGTQINMNVLDREKLLEANEDPTKYPDLVVRVTGFSAYFASLSPEFRQLVVDRMLAAG